MGELQDIEVALPVKVAVGIVLSDLVARKVRLGRIVQATRPAEPDGHRCTASGSKGEWKRLLQHLWKQRHG